MTFAEWWGTVHTEVTERMVGEELAEFVWLAQQKRIAELEEANKWIRTEDQRPRDGQHVWVYSEWHDFSTDAFYHRPDVWEDQLGNVAQVSHWMTLPDTPESEGGADDD